MGGGVGGVGVHFDQWGQFVVYYLNIRSNLINVYCAIFLSSVFMIYFVREIM